GMLRHMVMSRGPEAQKNLKAVPETIPVVAVERARPKIECELSAQSDVDLVSVGKIAHVADGNSVDGKNFLEIDRREHEFVARFLDPFPARVNRVALALIIRLEQDGFGFAFMRVVVLSPDERCRPIRVRAEPLIIYERRGG